MGTQTPLDENATIAQNAAPAGGLAISANDMSRWLLTQLGRGKIPGSDKRLFSEEQSQQMWTGVGDLRRSRNIPPEFAAAQPHYNLYALGWDLSDYRGAKVVGHDGAVLGSQATIALLPGQERRHLHRGQQRGRRDHPRPARRVARPLSRLSAATTGRRSGTTSSSARLNQAAKQVQTAEAKPAAVGPSLPLDHYVGDYTDPWYGTIKVRQAGKGLTIAFPHSTGMEGPLTHYQYDTFKTNPTLKWVEPAYVTFSIDADGKVDRVTMKPVSPTADFSWDYQDLLFTRQEGD